MARQELLERPAEFVPFIDQHALKKGIEDHFILLRRLANEFRIQTTRCMRLQNIISRAMQKFTERTRIEQIHMLRIHRKRMRAELRNVKPGAVRARQHQ